MEPIGDYLIKSPYQKLRHKWCSWASAVFRTRYVFFCYNRKAACLGVGTWEKLKISIESSLRNGRSLKLNDVARRGANIDSQVEREGVHGSIMRRRHCGRAQASNLPTHHRLAQTPKASLPQTPPFQTRRRRRFALLSPFQVLDQNDHDWVSASLSDLVFLFMLLAYVCTPSVR